MMTERQLNGAILVASVTNDIMTGEVKELCYRIRRDAPALFAHKFKYLTNLLEGEARKIDAGLECAVRETSDDGGVVWDYMDAVSGRLQDAVDHVRTGIRTDLERGKIPYADIFSRLELVAHLGRVTQTVLGAGGLKPRAASTDGVVHYARELVSLGNALPAVGGRERTAKMSGGTAKALASLRELLTDGKTYTDANIE